MRVIRDEERPGTCETVSPLSGWMERGVNFTMHIVYRVALIKIPSYSGGNIVAGFRRLAKTAGVYVFGTSQE